MYRCNNANRCKLKTESVVFGCLGDACCLFYVQFDFLLNFIGAIIWFYFPTNVLRKELWTVKKKYVTFMVLRTSCMKKGHF